MMWVVLEVVVHVAFGLIWGSDLDALGVGGVRWFDTGLVAVCEFSTVAGRDGDVGGEDVCEIVANPQMISGRSA